MARRLNRYCVRIDAWVRHSPRRIEHTVFTYQDIEAYSRTDATIAALNLAKLDAAGKIYHFSAAIQCMEQHVDKP